MADKVIASGWAAYQWMPNLFTWYKINYQQWRELWERQEGKCGVCKTQFAHPYDKERVPGVKPEVDHRHVEGRKCEAADVRGLLCGDCNKFLGKIRDNATRLEGMVKYLRAHGDWYDNAKPR